MNAASPRVAFYGDDFTGATDTLATAARAGLRTMLFLGVPTPAHLARAGVLDCVGIAGASRSMDPREMRAELAPVAAFFGALGAPLLHYKVCSTFDSSVGVGNVAEAVRALRPAAPNPLVAIVAGQPNLGRWCAFGNLFARGGAGAEVHRIDRHPTMSRHPVTPMHEADLRLHLGAQGIDGIESFDYVGYDAPAQAQDARLDALVGRGAGAVLFDVAHPRNLRPVGRMLWERASRATLLAVGASTVIQVLAAHWAGDDSGERLPEGPPSPPADGPVFVLSGSLSPVTAAQIDAAKSYERLPVDATRLVSDADGHREEIARRAAALLREGRNVLAYTSDPSSREAGARLAPRDVAQACAALAALVLARVRLRRVGIAGGDTSSHSVLGFDAWGLSYSSQVGSGSALCKLHSDDASLDGVEIMLKGGQMGPPDIFERLLHGAS